MSSCRCERRADRPPPPRPTDGADPLDTARVVDVIQFRVSGDPPRTARGVLLERVVDHSRWIHSLEVDIVAHEQHLAELREQRNVKLRERARLCEAVVTLDDLAALTPPSSTQLVAVDDAPAPHDHSPEDDCHPDCPRHQA